MIQNTGDSQGSSPRRKNVEGHIRRAWRGTPQAECRRCWRSLSAGALAVARRPSSRRTSRSGGAPSLFRPSACWKMECEDDDQGVVLLELVIPIMSIFIRKCDASSPPSDHDGRSTSDRKGRYSLRLLRRLISTDPALRRRQVVRFYLRRLPHLHLTTLLIWVRGDPAGCDKQSGHPPGLAARVGH